MVQPLDGIAVDLCNVVVVVEERADGVVGSDLVQIYECGPDELLVDSCAVPMVRNITFRVGELAKEAGLDSVFLLFGGPARSASRLTDLMAVALKELARQLE